ncbi:MAG: ATP-binding cassette domain-containing protein, partial [Coriobacteriales bacterium]|nr:ATP-binding cassette domain-containing protein [Coriobacteriales bacterium]
MLCFDHVSFRYPSQQSTALQEVDFAVEKGAYVVLLGANGSGKSTLARLANGLLVPDAGAVCVDGTSTAVHETLRELRSNVGVVSQDPDNQIVSTTVLDDVAFGPENLGLPPAVIAERCAAALALVGLSGFDERDPNTLSGGEKQRLVIAGVLAMEPSYLVLDEPCSMLDAMGRSEVRAAIAALRARGHGILHITHDLDETLSASKVLVLEKGKLVFSGSPDELLAEGALLERCGIGPTPPPLAPTPPPAQAPPQAPAQGSPAQAPA